MWEDLGTPELQGKVSTVSPVTPQTAEVRWEPAGDKHRKPCIFNINGCFAHCSNKDVAWEKADRVGARYQDHRATKRVERDVQRTEPRACLTHYPLAVYGSDDQASVAASITQLDSPPLPVGATAYTPHHPHLEEWCHQWETEYYRRQGVGVRC